MNNNHIAYRTLQMAVLVGGCVPVLAGGYGVLTGWHLDDISLDSHVRYLSGLLLAIGLTFWSLIPRLAVATRDFRILTVIVVVGGLGRLMGLITVGVPSTGMVCAVVMELVVTPALCLWQASISRSAR